MSEDGEVRCRTGARGAGPGPGCGDAPLVDLGTFDLTHPFFNLIPLHVVRYIAAVLV